MLEEKNLGGKREYDFRHVYLEGVPECQVRICVLRSRRFKLRSQNVNGK